MLVLALALAALLPISWLAGLLCLQAIRVRFDRCADLLYAACWIGAGGISLALTAVSLFTPLTWRVGLLLALVVAGASSASPATRGEIRRLKDLVRLPVATAALAFTLGAALYMSQPVTLYDTGLYHYGAIHWLTRHGAVFGLALLHCRFGFASSWFALAAPFDHGTLEARMAVIPNALAFEVSALLFVVAIWRLVGGRGRRSDSLYVGAAAVVAATAHVFHTAGVSASPNYAIALITMAVAWAILVVAEGGLRGWAERRSSAGTRVPVLLAAVSWGIKVLGGPALAVALLFHAVSGPRGRILRRLGVGTAACFILLIPLLATEWVVSGCLLFPLPWSCLDVPWGYVPSKAAVLVQLISDWPRWLAPWPPAGASQWGWVDGWLREGTATKSAALGIVAIALLAGGTAELVWRRRANVARSWLGPTLCLFLLAYWCGGLPALLVPAMGAVVVGVAHLRAAPTDRVRAGRGGSVIVQGAWTSVAIGVALASWILLSRAPNVLMLSVAVLSLLSRGRAFAGGNWALALGLAGIAFTMYAGPSIWYVLGCVAVTFGVWIAGHADTVATLLAPLTESLRQLGEAVPVSLLMALSLALAASVVQMERTPSWPYVRRARQDSIHLLAPAPLPRADVRTVAAHGFTFKQPLQGDQCWAAPQPCTPEDARSLALRDPALGVGGGFIRYQDPVGTPTEHAP